MNPVEIEMNFPAEHGGNVFGQFDAYMKKIEKTLHVSLILRGDHLKCIGTQQAVNHAISVIDELLELSKRGNVITEQNVNYALSLSMEEKSPSLLELDKDVICHTIQGKAVKPKTLGQQKYVDAIKNKMITFGVGPAGTGKTYLAMAMAITAFKNDEVSRIILTRPAIEVSVQNFFFSFKPHVHITGGNSFKVHGKPKRRADTRKRMPQDFANRIEVACQLVHIGRCRMS